MRRAHLGRESGSAQREPMLAARSVAMATAIAEPLRRMMRSLTARIFLGLVVGIGVGIWVHSAGADAETLAWLHVPSQIFLNLIKCIIAPLIVTMLVVGIAGSAALRQLGRLGVRTFGYFIAVTTLALFVGLAAVNLVRPGDGIRLAVEAGSPAQAQAQQIAANAAKLT